MRIQFLFLLLLSCASACAASAERDEDPGEDVGRDIAVDVPDEFDAPEDTVPDLGEDIGEEDTSDQDALVDDTGDDAVEADAADVTDAEDVQDTGTTCEVLASECEPWSRYCTTTDEGVGVGFCSRCGSELRVEICDASEVCDPELPGGANCRPCEGDECPIMNACEPRSRSCLDYNTVQICGDDGTVDTTADCPTGRRCFNGNCGSAGRDTGETCEVNSDPTNGCLGQTCLCGEEHGTSVPGTLPCQAMPSLAAGYCTTGSCMSNKCNTSTEACVDFGIWHGFDSGAYCITRESCTRVGQPCGDRSGFVCTELPGRAGLREPVTWNLACWTPTPRIGAACSSNSDCIGGECRSANVAGNQVSYCTMPCGEDAECPSNAACLRDPDGMGYICLANANATSCPRLESQPLFISTTPPLQRYGRGSQSACYFAN